jgi:hypothetical protein
MNLLDEPMVKEARRFAELAVATIDTLDLGPLDYNVAEAVDRLRTAAKLLEEFGRGRP